MLLLEAQPRTVAWALARTRMASTCPSSRLPDSGQRRRAHGVALEHLPCSLRDVALGHVHDVVLDDVLDLGRLHDVHDAALGDALAVVLVCSLRWRQGS